MNPIIKIAKEIYEEKFLTEKENKLKKLISDVRALYDGKCPLYEKCEVGYHTFNHANDVALATSFMIAGWNKVEENKLNPDLFFNAIAASLFHDSGYLKKKGDKNGKGGKFTFNHEPRSAKIAIEYLKKNNYNERIQKVVGDIILLTDFKNYPQVPEYFTDGEKVIASIVATADLIAQMSDPNYVGSLEKLYEEMKEAYEFEGYDNLRAKGIKIYESSNELKENIWEFFEEKVIPRLIALGSVYKYFKFYFPAGRNPYGESILANLTHKTFSEFKWQRIEKLLKEMGSLGDENIKEVLKKQKKKSLQICSGNYSNEDFIGIIKWLENQSGKNCIGDILINLGAAKDKDLRKAIENHILPSNIINEIDNEDWPKLLLISMMLGQIRYLPHIFTQSLEIINELTECECSSILLSNKQKNSLIFTVVTGPHKDELKDMAIPINKGIAGWVYYNGEPAIINEVNYDERFNDFVDKSLGFQTRSVLAVPLKYNNNIIGVIEAVNKKDGIFDKRDVSLLSIYSNQFVFTIDSILWTIDKIKEKYEDKKG